ncbi:MAG: NAD(P)/FAD-dependent oxidoreductase [Bdellovibrionales bacterium]|nr:NAD(P)/FAD-dependent oxidoreductase [Bdellovibrionales bacterium]
MHKPIIAIIGGGASGFFSALSAAEKARTLGKNIAIHLFESSSVPLKKVKISGGGRCNVTHFQFDVKEFTKNYPRGSRELISPFHQFQAQDTVEWFKTRGVQLIAEPDGRMFPNTHSSQTIINCFLEESEKNGIRIHYNWAIADISRSENQFTLLSSKGESFVADKVILCTGSSPKGYQLAESLGHRITDRAPSLFSFVIKHPLLKKHPGISFSDTELSLKIPGIKKIFKQNGPLLITHWGLSGPAILKLSAWAAREMKQKEYKALLNVRFLKMTEQHFHDQILHIKKQKAKSKITNFSFSSLSKGFWQDLLQFLNIEEKLWGEISKNDISALLQFLLHSEFQISDKNRYKDEFVECGGIDLKEIDFKTLQSKLVPDLFFAGELLDIDGITGGFNFQNAWTTGWIAGQNCIA